MGKPSPLALGTTEPGQPRVGVLAGGCNLNRNPLQFVQHAHVDISEAWQERFPLPFWLLGNHYSGIALKPPG